VGGCGRIEDRVRVGRGGPARQHAQTLRLVRLMWSGLPYRENHWRRHAAYANTR
jgi:hypothetical protein